MYVLGINAVFHDSSACLLKDGQLLAAAEDERFTHIKHAKRPIPFTTWEIPHHAIDYCLREAGIHLSEVDHIAYSFRPDLVQSDDPTPYKDRLFLPAIQHAPNQLVDGYPHHLQKRFMGSKTSDWQWHFVDHHLAHASSAYHPAPFHSAAVLTLDGRGEQASTTYNIGSEQRLERIGQVNLPHSLGLLYERVTTHLGFLHSSDEYKVMALASYGKPTFQNDFYDMIELGQNGDYRIENERLEARFGPKRLRHEPFTAHHFNIAFSLQKVLEETVMELCDWLQGATREENLCIAGGVGLNCVLNAKIRDNSRFKNVWVQPAAGDSGTALGAALVVDIEQRQPATGIYKMDHVYLGPEYSDESIEQFLTWAKIPYKRMKHVAEETADLLAQNKIIGWFQGRMEFGPRALGNRSILASPIDENMQSILNDIKEREDFRPVAPVVLEEDAPEWFKDAGSSPFMLFVHRVFPDKAHQIPAAKHIDHTARIQTINYQQNPRYYTLLKAFKQKTGVPVLINTSFNTLGKPIVCTPRDALESFWVSPFDALVMGSFLIEKEHEKENISRYSNVPKAETVN